MGLRVFSDVNRETETMRQFLRRGEKYWMPRLGLTLLAMSVGAGVVLGSGEPPKKKDDPPKLEDPFKDKDKPVDPEELFPDPDKQAAEEQAAKAGSPKQLGQKKGWAIVLATLSQEGHEEEIVQLREDFIRETGLSECWVDSTPKRSVLFYGHYEAFDSAEAKQELATIKDVKINDRKIFKAAFLTRTGDDEGDLKAYAGAIPQYNLRTAAKAHPGEEDLSTLQIAMYEPEEGKEVGQARQAAEDLVKQLRGQGYEAYYYHGPATSTVTVGIFGADAYDAQAGIYSEDVERMRKKFPFNSYNGRELKERVRTRANIWVTVRQPSFLVRVPEATES